jgi:hypothetical protein
MNIYFKSVHFFLLFFLQADHEEAIVPQIVRVSDMHVKRHTRGFEVVLSEVADKADVGFVVFWLTRNYRFCLEDL